MWAAIGTACSLTWVDLNKHCKPNILQKLKESFYRKQVYNYSVKSNSDFWVDGIKSGSVTASLKLAVVVMDVIWLEPETQAQHI